MAVHLMPLYEEQKRLDDHIIKKKNLHGVDLFGNSWIAFFSELGEMMNEWRVFKVWSDDRQPRYMKKTICDSCNGTGKTFDLQESDLYTGEKCKKCNGDREVLQYPLKEEFVDGLHFLLSLGNMVNHQQEKVHPFQFESIERQIVELVCAMGQFYKDVQNYGGEYDVVFKHIYVNLISYYIGLGYLLGFTWEQIEEAYFQKNKVNHIRQETGY